MSASMSEPMSASEPSSSLEGPLTRLKRHPERGSHERAAIEALLDGESLAHVAFATPQGPACIPMVYGRIGNTLYLHGSPAARMALAGRSGPMPMCLTVTRLDGIVVARSAFHHSLNYRSVMVMGAATLVDDPVEKEAALARITDAVLPRRWDECRPMTEKELKGTAVLALPLDQASLKVRDGAPVDDPEDLGSDIWAGVIPIGVRIGEPQAAKDVPAGATLPVGLQTLRESCGD